MKTKINVDTVPSNIPLLSTRDPVKPADMQLNVENDTGTTFGKSINPLVTESAYYTVPDTIPKCLIKDTIKIT